MIDSKKADLELTRGRLLASNSLWALLGELAAMLPAFVAIPLLVKGLGTARFGVITLSWALVGYFSLFDLGLGRALTQMIADRLGRNSADEVPRLAWTSLILMLALGGMGGLTLASLASWLVERVLTVPAELRPETLQTLYLLSATIPFVLTTAGLTGLLAAYQRFSTVYAVRVPLSALSYLGPLLVLPFSDRITHVVAALAAIRTGGCFVYLMICLSRIPALRGGFSFDAAAVGPLIRSGGWMTVTSAIGPVMVYLDRFLIGSWVSLSAVAWYVTPFEVASKILIVGMPLATVLFPAFAVSAASDRERLRMLFFRGVKYVGLAAFPIALTVLTLAREGLTLWLGPDFASYSTRVLQLLAAGIFINALGQLPFALIQGAGRPRWAALLHLAELPLYLLSLWWLVAHFGIEGAAAAWLGRVSLDTFCLFGLARAILGRGCGLGRHAALPIAAAIATLGLALALPLSEPFVRVAALILTLAGLAASAWFWLLRAERIVVWQSWLARSGTDRVEQA